TILDREPGRGGLQVWTEEDGWEDAPFTPGAVTINAGDLLARWSGGRWKSNRHRVLPPRAEAPDEDLVSLSGPPPRSCPVARAASVTGRMPLARAIRSMSGDRSSTRP
ncbi:MAG TPA: 2OG-Fe(II) oxygenase family protein, partial [Streptosporangiaceae bacterium]|nr:2OG-Fe(II) oxygenase family protein [Streptosporangiaceae bacterium]